MKRNIALILLNFVLASIAVGQSYILDMKRESARSDKLTGGRIDKTLLEHR